MANKIIKFYYFNPVTKVNGNIKIASILPILKELNDLLPEKRIFKVSPKEEWNIQLKIIKYDESRGLWKLGFLKNIPEAPFKTKLADHIDFAEELDEDEFIGHECCCLYDEKTGVFALQSNIHSIAANGIAAFFKNFAQEGTSLELQAIVDENEGEIGENDLVDYKTIIIGFTDIGRLRALAQEEDSEAISILANLSTSLGALTTKIELGVGRSNKKFLSKASVIKLANFFRKNKEITSTLKIKTHDKDNIRLIDLINYKVYDQFSINVTKTDGKTFDKIFNPMEIIFYKAIGKKFKYLNKITND